MLVVACRARAGWARACCKADSTTQLSGAEFASRSNACVYGT
jgi:hypothetical protein